MSQNRKSSKIDAFSVKIQIGAPVIRKIYLGNQAGTCLWGSLGSSNLTTNPFFRPSREGEPNDERGRSPGVCTGVPTLAVRYNR